MRKRNRFAEMVPPTPEDFHASVADALNRLESVPARRGSYGGMVRLAASVAVVIALGACLLVALRSRPTPEDRMVSLVESMPTPEVKEVVQPEMDPVGTDVMVCAVARKETQPKLEFGQWSVDAEACELTYEWTLTGPEDETLLVCANGTVLSGGVGQRDVYVYMMNDTQPMYALLGKEVLGQGNGSVMEAEGIASDFRWRGMVDPVLLLRVDLYRPLCEFVDDSENRPEAFEGKPVWLLARTEEHMEAMPIDYYGRYAYQTPYGSDWLDQPMVDFANAEFYRERGDLEEEMDALRRRSELRSILLETYGFAEPVVSYCVRIDMSAGSGTGATEIIEIVP